MRCWVREVVFAHFVHGAAVVLMTATPVHAHSGPPYPIVSNRIVGPYDVSIWTDPDATDDGSAAGKFWIVLQPSHPEVSLPAETRATVSIAPLDRAGPTQAGRTEPADRQTSRQFVALVIDHEGPFAVRVHVAGPLGVAGRRVQRGRDLRPSAAARDACRISGAFSARRLSLDQAAHSPAHRGARAPVTFLGRRGFVL